MLFSSFVIRQKGHMAGSIRRLPKWLDRAGFEADKLMRANRVRLEVTRLQDETVSRTQALGEKVMELAGGGMELDPALQPIVGEIMALHAELARKDEELRAINAEAWTEEGPIQPRASDPIAQRLQAYVEAKTSDFNCPKCGAIIRANKSFCPRCGRKVLR
jgi:hypothetical protein